MLSLLTCKTFHSSKQKSAKITFRNVYVKVTCSIELKFRIRIQYDVTILANLKLKKNIHL